VKEEESRGKPAISGSSGMITIKQASVSLKSTVRDISISMTSFSQCLKAELFRRAYGTDLALCDSHLLIVCANIDFLLTYLTAAFNAYIQPNSSSFLACNSRLHSAAA